MRLKPKRCSMRKVRYQLERQVEQRRRSARTRPAARAGRPCRPKPAARASRSDAVQRVEPAEQRPAQQHGGAEGHGRAGRSGLGERVVGGLAGARRAARVPAKAAGTASRCAATWRICRVASQNLSGQRRQQRGGESQGRAGASVHRCECRPDAATNRRTRNRRCDQTMPHACAERPEPDLDRPRDDRACRPNATASSRSPSWSPTPQVTRARRRPGVRGAPERRRARRRWTRGTRARTAAAA